MIGQTLDGKYRIVRLLGGGGMGVVYEAIAAATGLRVAVKLITAEVAQSETLIGRFQREARASGHIDTPHIVRVIAAEKDGASGLPYMVMEYLDGEDVEHLVERLGPLPPALALRVAAQACVGLQKAHEARVIHRDIKPANLYVARAGEGGARVVKLLDFGIAKIKMEDQAGKRETAGLTRTGSMLGSPLYMSPEQARGSKRVDVYADIWSLGVVLFQALTGRTPFHEVDALGELIIAICSEPVPPVQDFAPWVSAPVAEIVHTALRIDPAERYASAAAMLAAIEALLPDGSSIQEEMLRPLSAEERGKSEPRLPLSAYGTTASRLRVLLRGTDPASAEDLANAATMHAGIESGLTQHAIPAPPKRSHATAKIAAGAAVLVSIASVIIFSVLLPSAPRLQATASLLAAKRGLAPVPAVSSPMRAVKLLIAPGDALVEVDGARVTPKDGAVDVTGAPGSVHRVRVWPAGSPSPGDGLALVKEVVVSEGGAIPPEIELLALGSSGSGTGLLKSGGGASLSNPSGMQTKTSVNAVANSAKLISGTSPLSSSSSLPAPSAVKPAPSTALDTKFE